MNILIATDGALPVAQAVDHVVRLHRPGDAVIVMTAVNLPRRLLTQLRAVASGHAGDIAELVDAAGPGLGGFGGGDKVAERLAAKPGDSPLDDLVKGYLDEIAKTCTQPLVDALAEVDIDATAVVRETDNRTAATVIDVCRQRAIDVLVIGTTGQGRFDGFLGATGTKLVRHAPPDVLLVRTGPRK